VVAVAATLFSAMVVIFLILAQIKFIANITTPAIPTGTTHGYQSASRVGKSSFLFPDLLNFRTGKI
jgi:hypothetical protein